MQVDVEQYYIGKGWLYPNFNKNYWIGLKVRACCAQHPLAHAEAAVLHATQSKLQTAAHPQNPKPCPLWQHAPCHMHMTG